MAVMSLDMFQRPNGAVIKWVEMLDRPWCLRRNLQRVVMHGSRLVTRVRKVCKVSKWPDDFHFLPKCQPPARSGTVQYALVPFRIVRADESSDQPIGAMGLGLDCSVRFPASGVEFKGRRLVTADPPGLSTRRVRRGRPARAHLTGPLRVVAAGLADKALLAVG